MMNLYKQHRSIWGMHLSRQKGLPNGLVKFMRIWVHGFKGYLQRRRGAAGGANWFTWLFEQWRTVSSISVSSLSHHTCMPMLLYVTNQNSPHEVLARQLSILVEGSLLCCPTVCNLHEPKVQCFWRNSFTGLS